jgi:hypothetical protein
MGTSGKEEVYKDARWTQVAVFGAARRQTGALQSHQLISLGGVEMDSWKKAAVLASIAAAGILFMKKRYPAGVLATGVGLAVLASEYPEKFEKVRQSLPEYFERGMRVMEMAGAAGKRITEAAGRGAADAWEEIGG